MRRALWVALAYLSAGVALAESTDQKLTKTRAIMRTNFDALVNLQTYFMDPKKFHDPANAVAIQKNLDALAAFKHMGSTERAGADPGMLLIAGTFSGFLNETRTAFRQGSHGEYLRANVRAISGFCMNCHTMSGSETEFESLRKKVDKLPMSPYERAQFNASTRNYEQALEQFTLLIDSYPGNNLNSIDLAGAVRSTLNIQVRVKQDPGSVVRFLDRLASKKDIPDYFQRYVTAWRLQALQWQNEGASKSEGSPDVAMKMARTLFSQAEAVQLYAQDPAADLLYLRATGYIHRALQKTSHGKFRGEALYLLGVAYDSLQDPLLWAFDNAFFDTCIRENPHSTFARKSYARYSTKLAQAYSEGGEGAFLPKDETNKLATLIALAK